MSLNNHFLKESYGINFPFKGRKFFIKNPIETENPEKQFSVYSKKNIFRPESNGEIVLHRKSNIHSIDTYISYWSGIFKIDRRRTVWKLIYFLLFSPPQGDDAKAQSEEKSKENWTRLKRVIYWRIYVRHRLLNNKSLFFFEFDLLM